MSPIRQDSMSSIDGGHCQSFHHPCHCATSAIFIVSTGLKSRTVQCLVMTLAHVWRLCALPRSAAERLEHQCVLFLESRIEQLSISGTCEARSSQRPSCFSSPLPSHHVRADAKDVAWPTRYFWRLGRSCRRAGMHNRRQRHCQLPAGLHRSRRVWNGRLYYPGTSRRDFSVPGQCPAVQSPSGWSLSHQAVHNG